MNRSIIMLALAMFLAGGIARAQENEGDGSTTPTIEELGETVSGLGDRVTTAEGEIDKLKTTKISGYVQTEWQHFDQNTSSGGRAFYSNANKNFFTIRRGRVKVQHKLGNEMSAVVQADFTESGVKLKDAYMIYNFLPTDPDNDINVQIGSFNRPNYEVEYSSSTRESAERSQVVRAFYPDERDLGFMFTFRHTIAEEFDPKLQIGMYNGGGVIPETDPYKDIIARLTFPLPLGYDSPVHADLGASFYYGGIPQTVDSIRTTTNGTTSLVANDQSGSLAGWGNRQNFNIEAQVYLDILPWGGTILKGEVLSGKRQTAAVAAIARDSVKFIAASSGKPFQVRNQSGYYIYFVQNIEAWMQVAAKLDFFDRNTDMAGTQVTATDDAASSVLGFGANFFVSNMRFTLWYEMPKFAENENIQSGDAAGAFRTVDLKDNKTTIRFQYKF